ncbi:hypothetical protein GG344DRAFT_84070 [Lentinula edodes]|nr:hypothetical protein GG344DRAFT_84070 [Lentinula edodes]
MTEYDTLSFIALVGCLKLSLKEIVFQSLASLSYKLPRGSLSRISLHSPSSSSSPPSPISHSPLDSMMLLRFYRSCSLCLLFIGILLGTTSVTGSPVAGISHLERRGRTAAQVRIGYYRTSKAHDPKSMGWVQHHKKNKEDIECICFGIENANCFGLQIWPETDTMQALHVTALKMQSSRQSSPDPLYFLAQNHLSLKQSVLAEWKLKGYATVWDLLNDIPEVQKQIWASSSLVYTVHDQESYIELIKEYLITVGIIVETQ